MQAKRRRDVDDRVRRRLRELRTERGLTLQQVAAAAHIDVSTLSRLETGKRRLALDHIPALAAALGVTTDELLGAGAARRTRASAASRAGSTGMTMWPLTNRGPARRRARLPHRDQRPPHARPPAVLPVHDGHDWMYVLDGRLRLLLGDDDLTIEPGEAVEFATATPHWFGAVDGPVVLDRDLRRPRRAGPPQRLSEVTPGWRRR